LEVYRDDFFENNSKVFSGNILENIVKREADVDGEFHFGLMVSSEGFRPV
jgi:hypothetical protein